MADWVALGTAALGVISSIFGRDKDDQSEALRAMQEKLNKLQGDNDELEQKLNRLIEEAKKSQQECKRLEAIIQEPVKERKRKVDYINQLGLEIRPSRSRCALLGVKGSGKTTLKYLCGLGERPHKSSSDHTTHLEYGEMFLDLPGISWTVEYLLKLIALFVIYGFPEDIIAVGNDRASPKLSALSAVRIQNPIMVEFLSTSLFWKWEKEERIKLEQKEGKSSIRHVTPTQYLSDIYDMEGMQQLKSLGICQTATHEDDLPRLFHRRKQAHISPFRELHALLGNKFRAPEESKPETALQEQLFMLIYLYYRKYRDRPKSQLLFLNHATLQEFYTLE